jgi:hypothetical protein
MSVSNFVKLAVGGGMSSKNKDIPRHVKTMVELNDIGSQTEELRHINQTIGCNLYAPLKNVPEYYKQLHVP